MKLKWLATVAKFIVKFAPGVVEAILRVRAKTAAEEAANPSDKPPSGIEG
jgi:hypothetical protein